MRRLVRHEHEAPIAEEADRRVCGAAEPVEVVHRRERVRRPWVVPVALGVEAKRSRGRSEKRVRVVRRSTLQTHGETDRARCTDGRSHEAKRADRCGEVPNRPVPASARGSPPRPKRGRSVLRARSGGRRSRTSETSARRSPAAPAPPSPTAIRSTPTTGRTRPAAASSHPWSCSPAARGRRSVHRIEIVTRLRAASARRTTSVVGSGRETARGRPAARSRSTVKWAPRLA
jgi:hypothetical protein